MDRKIYKYRLYGETNLIELILGFKIVHFRYVDNEWFIWVLQDLNRHKKQYKFEMVRTGVDIPNSWEYVDTAASYKGHLVFHLFKL